MSAFDHQLCDYAEVIVRIGLNLQEGQRLLIAEPYELQGVAQSSVPLVEAIKQVVVENKISTSAAIEVIWGNGAILREFAVRKDWRGLSRLVEANTKKMSEYVQRGDALLFLLGSQPGLMADLPSRQVAESRRIGAEHFGTIAHQLMQGAVNWTAAPAPSSGWADLVYSELPAKQRLSALWNTVFAAMRIEDHDSADQVEGNNGNTKIQNAWHTHLKTLEKKRDALNAQRFKSLTYQGEGTDLTVDLPPAHRWCTANLRSQAGVSFVANLPTEEVFTLPHRESTRGIVRVTRPINFGGATIEGIELEFKHGSVVNASAKTGESLLMKMLETDPGAGRLGEVAIAGKEVSTNGDAQTSPGLPWAKDRLFHHVLLDENAGSHIALGEGYGFCLQSPNAAALNRSLIHVDLPIAAAANLRK